MLINLVCLVLLSFITTALIHSYGSDNQLRFLENAATSIESSVSKEFAKYITGSSSSDTQGGSIIYEQETENTAENVLTAEERKKAFSEFLLKSEEDIRQSITLLSENIDGLFVFITDQTGEIYISGGAKMILESQVKFNSDGKYVVDSGITERLVSDGKISENSDLNGFMKEENIIYALPIKDSRANVLGSVFACTTDAGVDSLLDAMMKTIIMSSLWILLASLVATYFISERLVAPIKAMSRAAKSFADGKFDVRVPVTGSDEIAELATAFNNMASSLQELEDMRRTFLSNVSHDLRTPMTTISGFIDGILDGAIPPEKHEHYLGVIASEVRRLSRLVSTLLDITRMQAGERKFVMAPFDICEMARLILISFDQKIEEKHLDVSFNTTADRMLVCADRDAIHQVLYNICDNGIKFSRDGGRYIIDISENNGKTLVSVYNEGIGIPEAEQKYIFDRFYKSDKSRGLDKTGVGLGMYIARTIIEAHGERIWLESVHGEYCKFSFTLPSSIDAEQVGRGKEKDKPHD